ncbi:hypothetical protein JNN96_30630 [Mycobacterium sp. DSM 3803]|jgi:uncharacterized protein (DUF1778 family)|nr:hypothetical protein [Mycobacterium sp. DSM 3803]OKH65760.1 hypothetical protein EB73_21050 [Mycobacterium sp. SWH-M3]
MAAATSQRKSRSGSETRQRDKKIDVRYSQRERRVVELAAQSVGLSPAGFVRSCALAAAKEAGFDLTDLTLVEDETEAALAV